MMDLNGLYSGFRVKAKSFIKEVHSDAFILEHEKSGARVFYLKNDDDNKVFSISFRTPPADDTGLPHILEHSVLCGSRKYPLKEPFVELVKGSLNTFLNAMTFPDKTMYPVASRNDKDFRNLMDVYLDAVFYPNIYENKYTLQQEGWHYEITSPDGPLEYKGVVYNEMKGVYSSPDALLENHTMRALFPDSPYGFESGGFPDAVPGLTQQAFEKFHSEYYHPSNSFIFLYGDMDIEDTLSFIDREYLKAFTRINVDSVIKKQPYLPKTQKVAEYYPLPSGDTLEDKTFYSWNVVVGDALDIRQNYAFQILEHYLLETEAAPLKRAMTEAGIVKEVSGSFVKSVSQPIFSVSASGGKSGKTDEFVSIIYKTLQEITIKGIDKELLTASLNRMEFLLREADFGSYPKGLIYAMNCMDTWLYDGEPADYLCYDRVVTDLRGKIAGRYFEGLIETYLLDNTHRAVVTLEPKEGMQEEHQKEIDDNLSAIKASLSKEKIEGLIEDTKTLLSLQGKVDSAEALATIPLLARTDISRDTEKLNVLTEKKNDAELLYLEEFTNEIAYVSLFFDASSLLQEQILYAHLLKEILGRINTDKYTYQELAKHINTDTGGISFNLNTCSDKDDADMYNPKFAVGAKVLVRNIGKLSDLVKNILSGSILTDQERIKELVEESKAMWDAEIFARGLSVVNSRLASYFAKSSRYYEQGFLSYYRFLDKISTEDFSVVVKNLEAVAENIFSRDNIFAAYCCDKSDKAEVEKAVLDICSSFTKKKSTPCSYEFACDKNEGIITSAQVQYVAAGGNFRQHGHDYTGAMKVLENIMRYDYLWTNIRVKGGAYGAFTGFDYNGNTIFSSYRDPNLAETLDIFKAIPDYLENFAPDEREMTKYVIGTISQLDRPLTASQKLDLAVLYHLRGISYDFKLEERRQVIDCSGENIKALAPVVKDLLSDGYVCVMGAEGKIKGSKEIFGSITNALA